MALLRMYLIWDLVKMFIDLGIEATSKFWSTWESTLFYDEDFFYYGLRKGHQKRKQHKCQHCKPPLE